MVYLSFSDTCRQKERHWKHYTTSTTCNVPNHDFTWAHILGCGLLMRIKTNDTHTQDHSTPCCTQDLNVLNIRQHC